MRVDCVSGSLGQAAKIFQLHFAAGVIDSREILLPLSDKFEAVLKASQPFDLGTVL